MDITMVVLRLVHLFSSVLWVGFTFGMVLFIAPSVEALGAEAQKFMQHFSQRSGVSRWMAISGGLSVLSGAWMYYRLFGPLAPLNTGTGLALTVGSLAGILALLIGSQISRTTKAIGALGASMAASGPPEPEQLAAMGQLQERMARLTSATAILMVVALAGMTLSEYFVL